MRGVMKGRPKTPTSKFEGQLSGSRVKHNEQDSRDLFLGLWSSWSALEPQSSAKKAMDSATSLSVPTTTNPWKRCLAPSSGWKRVTEER